MDTGEPLTSIPLTAPHSKSHTARPTAELVRPELARIWEFVAIFPRHAVRRDCRRQDVRPLRSIRPSDPEMSTPEVTGYRPLLVFRNVVALKNRLNHKVDADGERR